MSPRRTGSRRALRVLGLAWAAGLVLWPGVAALAGPASPLTPAEARGKQIYLTGESPSGGPITAWFGEDRLELPGSSATCGSCHGHDGVGRPESGVLPTNVTWKYLTKSYGHVHGSGLAHGPFDDESLNRYMATGIYPGGGRGDPAMPTYEMASQDLDDLVAYLKRLGDEPEPGVTETTIRVGTLVPAHGRLAEIGGAIRRGLEAYFDQVNRQGGIYGRGIALESRALPAGRDAALDGVKGWLARDEPFVLVSAFTPGLEVDVQQVLAERRVPLIGPVTLHPIGRFALNRDVFYLFPGLVEQVRALLQYASEGPGTAAPRVALVYPADAPLDDVVAAAEAFGRGKGWPELRRHPYAPGALDAAAPVGALRDQGVDLVLHLGVEPELRAFLEGAARARFWPRVLAAGALAGRLARDAPAGFDRRLFLAYPTLPQDRKDWGMRELSRLIAAYELPSSHIQVVIAAVSAAKVAVEALRQAGRELSREKFTASLETLYQFDTGLTPPLTYTRNRRMGASGAYVLEVDRERRQEPRSMPGPVRWVEVK